MWRSDLMGLFIKIELIIIMQQHQHGPGCRHGHGHAHGGHGEHAGHGGHGGHSHGHGHGHSHGPGPQGMGFSNQLHEMAPEEYFKELWKKFNEKRVFFWQEVLMGLALDKAYERYGLEFMRSVSCNTPTMIVGSLESAISMDCIPNQLKHVASGLFFPILFLLFFNFNVVVGIGHDNPLLRGLVWLTLVLYLVVGLRGSGELNNREGKEKSKEIYSIRPYLENPNSSCSACNIVRFYRSMHCPFCKSCITKHTRHSFVFGICIGAANEIFALLYFLSFWLTQVTVLWLFFKFGTYGLITKVMFYLMNGAFCWMSFTEFAKLAIFNIAYGITEGELKTWMIQQYLLKIPEREFQNNVDQGFLQNLINSISAGVGISGFQSENHDLPQPLAFPNIDPSKNYRINWAKAYIYMVPLLPCHKNRQQVTELLVREQPKMIEMFRLQKQMKDEVLREAGEEKLNEFQIQQRMAMKMQAHMMKNMPQMMQPSAEQQRTIQLQMLSHMRNEFAAEPDLAPQIDQLHAQLTNNQLTPIEANMRMRQLQQELMQRRMSKVMKQHQEQQQQLENKKKREEDEEAPMTGLADEEL